MQGVQDGAFACIERFVALSPLRKIDDYLIRVWCSNVGDLLDHAVTEALLHQSLAQFVNRWRAGESYIDECAAFEINTVIQAAFVNPGRGANDEQRQRQGDKILRLAHPIEVDVVMKKLHPELVPFLRHRTGPVSARKRL